MLVSGKKLSLALCLGILLTGCGRTPNDSTERKETLTSVTECTESISGTTEQVTAARKAPQTTMSAKNRTSKTTTTKAITTSENNVYTDSVTAAQILPAVTTAAAAVTVMTTTSVTHTTPPTKYTTPVDKKLSELSLQEKVCQMFIVTPEQLTGNGCVTIADGVMEKALADYNVGGIIFFAQNLTYTEQTVTMLSQCQAYSKKVNGIGLLTAVDEEGGTVARASQKLGMPAVSNMEYYGAMNDRLQAYSVGNTIGSYLHELGFNLDFAPVADVNLNSENELGSRIFSSDPNVVSDMVASVVSGIEANGVCSTLKHFPGLGAADGNTHYDNYVHIYRSLDELRNAEFIPFRGGIAAGADCVMVGHQIVSGTGDDLPSDLSYKVVTELLRNELGFTGLAVTDAQQMNTISGVYGSGGAAVMSVKAGIDLILMPADLPSAVDAVCNAVKNGEISEERINQSVRRILQKKYELGILG